MSDPQPPPENAAQGVDVSHYQGTIDWPKVRAAGKSFAFIKATEALGYVDPMFARNWDGARAAGVLRGAYHFFHENVDGVMQADFFLHALGSDLGELAPVVDVELAYAPTNPSAYGAQLRAFCDRVASSSGRRPLIYTGPGFFDPHVSWPKDDVFGLWVAHWTKGYPRLPMAWSQWGFWQYDNQGRVPGIGAPVDLDVFYGDEAQLRAYAYAPASSPPPPPSPGTSPTPVPLAQLYSWGIYDAQNPDRAPAYIGQRAVELLRDGDPLGVEHVEEHEGRIWKFRHETHGPNAQISVPHPGVGAKVLVPSAKLTPGSLDEARVMTLDLSDDFFAALAAMGRELGEDPADFLLVFVAESGCAPWLQKNGGTGLNMSMGFVLKSLGIQPADFAKMPAERQLPAIRKQWTASGAPFSSAARCAWANLYPGTMRRGDSPDAVVMARDADDAGERQAYVGNAALDVGKDGKVTLSDLAAWLDGAARRPRYQFALRRLRAAQGPHGADPAGGGAVLALCALAALAMVS